MDLQPRSLLLKIILALILNPLYLRYVYNLKAGSLSLFYDSTNFRNLNEGIELLF